MSLENVTIMEVQHVIEELRKRVENVTPPHIYEDTITFYRFLKARDFNVDKAEAMFRKHLTWRKTFQIDNILETFQPKEVFVKFIEPSVIGFDKDGDLVLFCPLGNLDVRTILQCVKLNNYMKHWLYWGQKIFSFIDEHRKQTGGHNFQANMIFDLEKLDLANATSKTGAEIMMFLSQQLQDHHPESMKTIYIINSPSYYVIAYSIIKTVLSNATAKKIRVYGKNGWKEDLLEAIDANVLPVFLGGTRTDPDGDPLCSSFIRHGGKFPSKYFLTEKDRWFKDRSLARKLTIEPNKKEKIFIEIKEQGSLIQWEFEVRNKDIGFGLFYMSSDNEVEILPVRKVSTPDGTEIDSYPAALVGTWQT